MLLTGAFMLIYVVAGGMLATTWVQIIKAVLLMTATIVLSMFVLERVGFNPIDLFNEAEAASPERTSTWRRACSSTRRSTRSRSAWRWCSARRACRTS